MLSLLLVALTALGLLRAGAADRLQGAIEHIFSPLTAGAQVNRYSQMGGGQYGIA